MNAARKSLRELRLERGLSLRRLEDLTGVNRATWSRIENGKLLPELEHIAALAAALEIPTTAWRIRFVLEARVDG